MSTSLIPRFNNSRERAGFGRRHAAGLCIVVAPTEQDYSSWDKLDFEYLSRFTYSHVVIYSKDAKRLSDLLLEVGMVTSRGEFKRKIKEGAFIIENPCGRGRRLKCDFTFTTHRERFMAIRLGQRYLEIIGTGTEDYRGA